MKYLVASDIHGSAYYCEKLMEVYEREHPEFLLLLGDILYHGPRNDLPEGYAPKECIKMLNSIADKIICVQGNCDAEVDQMVLNFPIKPEYIRISHDRSGRTLIVTHGHHINKDNMVDHKDGDILLHGHTHVPCLVNCGDFYYMNPGSTSIPKENSHHGYMIIDDEKATWYDFDGNIKNEFVM